MAIRNNFGEPVEVSTGAAATGFRCLQPRLSTLIAARSLPPRYWIH